MAKQRMVRFLSASALVLGMISTQEASASLANTKHNLGSSNRLSSGFTSPLAGKYIRSGTGYLLSTGGVDYMASPGDLFSPNIDEICVFCHTSHGGVAGVAPLWNKRATNTAGSYTVYSSGTMQGSSDLNNTTQYHMSLACLSCHDGTQAMDTMINLAASGVVGSLFIPGNAGDQSGTDLSSSGGRISMLGTDLRNDHPVGIPYCGGASGTACNDLDFWSPKGTSATNAPGFYVGANLGLSSKNIRLYPTSSNNGTDPYNTTVECGSCHDPHNESAPTFLRFSNAGSAVCSTCHTK